MLKKAGPVVSTLLRADVLFEDCEDETALLVAVSGGPDSMALLILLTEWSRAPVRPTIYAATVDHGLRSDSRQEAQVVGTWCESLGIPHFILPWVGDKPKTRLQERAREARYRLLDSYAAQIGASILMTAHHADDQYETVLFRLQRGSGIGGLAGMPRRLKRGAIAHVRPLLDFPKSSLVAYCRSVGHPFFEDPSNVDPRFARTQLRHMRTALEPLGFGSTNILRLSRRAARADLALREAAEALGRMAFVDREADFSSFRRGALARSPEELVLRLLRSECARVSGRQAPRLEQSENLMSSLYPLLAAGSFRRALGGTLFALKGDRLELRKEIRASPRSQRTSRQDASALEGA